jgi:hypothetical protein
MNPHIFPFMQIMALAVPIMFAGLTLGITRLENQHDEHKLILGWLVIMIMCQLLVCALYKIF